MKSTLACNINNQEEVIDILFNNKVIYSSDMWDTNILEVVQAIAGSIGAKYEVVDKLTVPQTQTGQFIITGDGHTLYSFCKNNVVECLHGNWEGVVVFNDDNTCNITTERGNTIYHLQYQFFDTVKRVIDSYPHFAQYLALTPSLKKDWLEDDDIPF